MDHERHQRDGGTTTISALFMVNPTNVARAAIRVVEGGLAFDAPVNIALGSYSPAGEAHLFVAVTGQHGQTREIQVDTEGISAWNEDKRQGLIDAPRLVDELARRTRSAVQEITQR